MAQAARQAPAFTSILDRPSGEIERPKPMPVGTYVCVVQGQPKFDKSTKKQTDYVEFTLKFLEASDDVDEEALAAIGGIADKTIRNTYYLTEASAFRLVDFLDHVSAGSEDMSLAQRIPEAVGKQVLVTISHRASDDGQSVFAQVKSTAPVQE